MKGIMMVIFLLGVLVTHASWADTFSDGDFTNGLSWSGTVESWTVTASSDVSTGAAGSSTLRLNAASGSTGLKYLSFPFRLDANQTWQFWVGRRAQAATASNSFYFWLFNRSADPTAGESEGYRFRWGDDVSSGDRLFLEYIKEGKVTNILSSAAGTPNGLLDIGLSVRITRDASGLWSLYTSALPQVSGSGSLASDPADEANTQVFQGSAQELSEVPGQSGYVVVAATHSAAAAARTGLEFDQLFVFASTSLPVRLQNISVNKEGDGLRLKWGNATESSVMKYSWEQSVDGWAFRPLIALAAKTNDGGESVYTIFSFYERLARYFRLCVQEMNGSLFYGPILRIDAVEKGEDLTIFPNPGAGAVTWQLAGLEKGTYWVRITGMDGRKYMEYRLIHHGGVANGSVESGCLSRGAYYLTVAGDGFYATAPLIRL